MNNNSKRKNRPSAATRFSSDNRTPKGRPPAQGVYNNTYFMHAATALVGNVVQVRLRSGNIYEGVFRTFSPNFDVALELPFCIKTSKNANVSDEGKTVPNYIIFPFDNVVNISAKDFDSQYATVGNSFQIDAAISEKCNGSRFDEKELEPWDPSGMNGDVDIELDGAANGWDPNEMFKKNENVFGVQSTFDDSLSDYTVQLANKDSEEYKEAEMKAEKLAAEIENNPACRERLDLENGDEETLFAAVERPSMEMERERERERDREREREREREHERMAREREQRERDREAVSERYITKSQRGITAPPAPSNIAANTATAAPPQAPSPHAQRDLTTDRAERVNTAPAPVVMGQSNSTQSPAPLSSGMKSSAPQSTSIGGQDNSNKYATVMKRKSMPQGNKLVRNTPPPNNSASMPQSGGGGANTSGGGGNQHTKGNSYQSMPLQNTSSYVNSQNYSTMVHGSSQYRHQSNMGGASKQNGDSNVNSGKPMQQRNMRQYQNSQSNSSMSYGDSQHQMQMNKSMHTQQHGPPHGSQQQTSGGGNSSSSPPLQTSGSHGGHSQAPQGSMHGGAGVMAGPANQPPPQPQRLIRARDTQLQDLRQFGQDFQLAGGAATQTQQLQQPQQQQHIQMVKNSSAHNPQPAVSPPHQQQQPHLVQQQHVAMQHVPGTTQQHLQQHHVQSAQQQQQHAHQAQQHYVVQQTQQHAPQHVQQQQQQQKQLQQQQHVENANIMHIPKGHPHSVPAQQQVQQQQPPMEQPIYHAPSMTNAPPTQQQSMPVVLSSPVVENVQHQQQQQQQQMQQQPTQQLQQQQQPQAGSLIATNINNNKAISDSANVINNNNANNPSSGSNSANGEKTSPPTAVVKKTHVLNPSAKPFTPRSPSTPNPSRPHTPQTPVPMAGIYATSSQLATNQTQIYAVMQPPATFQAPMHQQASQQPRLRRSNYAPMGASQMHVSATTATGQPLLATAPIQPFIYHQQAAHPTHFPSQPYTQMPLQFLAQTPPSTTPSPGQPHQPFHQPPQPSPAGGGQPFAQQTQPPAYVMSYPVLHPSQLVPNHHYYQAPQHAQQSQQFQIVMQQHPNQ